jgi:hypothetical protein
MQSETKHMNSSSKNKKEIALFVSGYSPANAGMEGIKMAADQDFVAAKEADGSTKEARAFKELKTKEGRAGYDSLRKLWVPDLDSEFENCTQKPMHSAVVGMFANELEPSSQLTISFESEAHWFRHEAAVKRSLIRFGTTYNQCNVHLLDLSTLKPKHVGYGQLVGDVTFQKKIWIFFKPGGMGAHHTFDNFRLLKDVADEAGIEHLTSDIYGKFAMLVYSIGSEGHVEFDSRCEKLNSVLRKRDLIGRPPVVGAVALTNYGLSQWGGSHSYAEALEYLKDR